MNDATTTAAVGEDAASAQRTRPVIDVYWVGLFTAEEVRFKTPGINLPQELIEWLRTYPGVSRMAVAEGDTLGQTDYLHFTWTENNSGNFGSVVIEMICAYFGWDRPSVLFTGNWNEEEDEIAYAKQTLATTVPPLRERRLVLQSGLDYVVNGNVKVRTVDGRTVLRAV